MYSFVKWVSFIYSYCNIIGTGVKKLTEKRAEKNDVSVKKFLSYHLKLEGRFFIIRIVLALFSAEC